MSEELSYKVSVEGTQDLDKLANTIEKVNGVLRSGSGAGKSLEEMRKILVGMKGQSSIIDQLRSSIVDLNKSSGDMRQGFTAEFTSLKSVLINELRAIQGVIATNGVAAGAAFNESIADGMNATTKKIDAEAEDTIKAIKKAQKMVAAATNASNSAYQVYNPNSGLKGRDVTPKGVSATPMSVDDVRRMLGMPDRAGMATFATQLKQQMQEELAKVQLRGRSATPMSLEDTRALLNAPSRADMSTFASQLKAQMQEELAKTKLRGRSATPMSLEDTRALLGAPSRAEMSTLAGQLKAQMQEELAKTKLRASSATRMTSQEDTRALLGLPSRAEMTTLAAQLKAQMQEAMSLSKYQQRGSAMGMAPGVVGGAFSDFDAVKRNAQSVRAELAKLGEGNQFDKMSAGAKRLNTDLGDTHSLARGLASGFDLLWLTWGKLAPLFTGAAISFGVRKTFDIGAEVEYNIKMMEMLGQSTKEQAPIIRQALRDIDQTTQFSLLDLSKNMVVLGQSGKTLKESLQMLKPIADLASLGQVDLKTSVDLVNQSMALFNLTAADSGKIAAQVFEATKTGVLDVENISGSLKYAGEVNTRFGKSLAETLTVLNALAEGGIKASSGGTSFINFLRDLNGRTPKATKALADLSKQTGVALEAFNADGTQKSVVELISQMVEATKKLNPKDVDKFLGAFFTARGGRTWYTAVREGTVNIAQLQKQIEEADPAKFAASALGLMDTAKGALDVMKGAMVGALDTTFEKYSDGFVKAIRDATAFIGSSDFQGTLNTMVGGVIGLYDALKTLWPALELAAKGFVVFKAATVGMAVFQSIAAGVAGLGASFLGLQTRIATTGVAATALSGVMGTSGAAMIGQQAAANAAATGQTALQVATTRTSAITAAATGVMRGFAVVASFLANPLVGIAVALGLVAYTYSTTANAAKEHAATFTDAVVTNGKVSIAQWDKEIGKLKERNAILAGGNALSRYSEQMDIIKQKDAEVAKARKAMEISQKADSDGRSLKNNSFAAINSAAAQRDTKEYLKQLAERQKMTDDVKAMVDKDAKDQKDAQDKAEAAAKKSMNEAMGNPNVPRLPGVDGKGGKGGDAQSKYFDAVEARQKNANEYAKAMWQEMYNTGEMSATDYYNSLTDMANREADSVIAAMRRQIAAGKDVEQAEVNIEKAEQDRTLKSVQLNNQRVAALTREENSLEGVRQKLKNMAEEGERNSEVDIFGIGNSAKQTERLRALANITKPYDILRGQVAENLAKKSKSKDYDILAQDAKKALSEIDEAETARKDKAVQNWSIIDAAQSSWVNGASRAWQTYADEAANKSDQINGLMGNMFKGMEDMLVNFVTTGKLGFSDFAKSILADLLRIEARAATSAIFKTMGSSFSGALSSIGNFLFNAKGGVYNSPSLSSYSNQVHSKPQMFAFAKGAGVFGEAGPEAIMPLTRTSGGDLGVKMAGGGGGMGNPVFNIETNIHMAANGTATAQTNVTSSGSDRMDQVGKELNNLVRGVIAKETEHGGLIWRANNGY